MLTQEQYDTIKLYVSNGHALHPEMAAELLSAFEALHRAADTYLEDSTTVALSEELYDDGGWPRLRLDDGR